MQAKIALVAPHSGLLKIAEHVRAVSGEEFEIFEGDLAVGLAVARDLEKQGYDVIISRGGTYLMIQEDLKTIPVVEIQVTGYDLIRALKQIKGAKNLALCGYPNIFWGASDITDLFGFRVQNFVIQGGEENVRKQLLEAKDIEMVVGDTAGVRVSKSVGYKTHLIQSGQEAILAAVQEAKRAAALRFTEARRVEELKTILNFIDNGIISINAAGRITVINPAAEEKLGVEREQLLGHLAQDVIENTRLHEVLQSGKAELGELQKIAGQMMVTNRIPLIVQERVAGVVATFQDVNKLQSMERKVRLKLHQKGLVAKYTFPDIIHSSKIMAGTIKEAKKYASVDSTVLISAETGAGKELFAQSIHNASARSDGPFVAINCGALPASLMESELFGYAEGAFTGAKKHGKPGIFELAHGGTLFLDEIGEIPLSLQIQLLRVLQERVVRRIGDDRVLPVNVRVIAATNKDLYQQVEQGDFRSDLYYRVDVLQLAIPPLRTRTGDVDTLFRHFARHFKWTGNIYAPQTLEILNHYHWPGNVRELENMVEKLWLLSDGTVVTPTLLNKTLPRPQISNPDSSTLENQQRRLIMETLEKCDGDKSKAAEMLGISRTTLWRKLNVSK